MAAAILILRPEPGASATAARGRALGLDPIVAPLFDIQPVAWDAPDPLSFDAVMLTSANAARQAGPALARYARLPCYAVGEATAAAARDAGFETIVAGAADAEALVGQMRVDGIRRALHLCGADRIEADAAGIAIERQIVYRSIARADLPAAARRALDAGVLALLHSPRAAALFASLVDDRSRIGIAAISPATAEAAGVGWARLAWAEQPTDQALLELARKLCNSGGEPGQFWVDRDGL